LNPWYRSAQDADLQTAIGTLIKVAENVEIVRWIELPVSVLLFLLAPGDPDSGAVYVLDRKKGIWYAVDFEGPQLPLHRFKVTATDFAELSQWVIPTYGSRAYFFG
jgi:hypothetical protein